MQCLPLPPPQPARTPSTANLQSSHLMALNSNTSMHFDSSTPVELVSLCDALNQEIIEDGNVQALAREFVSNKASGDVSREARLPQAINLLLLVDCSMAGFPFT
ncbi:hypothetical protein C3L33_05022, partial [Rhododendron williamsianum]